MTCSVVAEPSPFIGRLTFTLLEATADLHHLDGGRCMPPRERVLSWLFFHLLPFSMNGGRAPHHSHHGGVDELWDSASPWSSHSLLPWGVRELVIRVTWQLLVYMMVWKLTHFYSFGTMCACHCAFCPLWKSANEVARPHVGLLPHCFGEPSHRLDLLALRTILPQHIKPLMPLTVSS